MRDILHAERHVGAAQGAFQLSCPNCHGERDHRTRKHWSSRKRYGG